METKRAPAVAFQRSWLQPLSLNGQAPNPAAVEPQIEPDSAKFGLQPPPSWREDVLANDWEVSVELLARIGGQLGTREPQLVPHFEAGFNLPAAAAWCDLAKLDTMTAGPGLPYGSPNELGKPAPHDVLAWLNRVHAQYKSVLHEQK
jgi:hypothetical protein